jgi:hypothetical protein
MTLGRRYGERDGMKTAPADVAGFQEILERKQAELTRMLRNRNDIAIEKSADQMDEIPSRLRSKIRTLTGAPPASSTPATWTSSRSSRSSEYPAGRPAATYLALLRELKGSDDTRFNWPAWQPASPNKTNRHNAQHDSSMAATKLTTYRRRQ